MHRIIIAAVAKVYGKSTSEILGDSQWYPLPEARRMVIHIMNTEGFRVSKIAAVMNRSKTHIYRVKEQAPDEIKIYKGIRKRYDAALQIIKEKSNIN